MRRDHPAKTCWFQLIPTYDGFFLNVSVFFFFCNVETKKGVKAPNYVCIYV